MSPSTARSRRCLPRSRTNTASSTSLVHAVAFAPADDLKSEFINTSREGFRIAHDVSVYSLIAVSRAAAPLMTEGGSIMTLTYLGAEKVVPNYNVMGVAKAALEASVRYLAADLGPKNIRVNAISAGPIKTLAARGIGATWRHAESRRRSRPAQAQRRSARSRRSRPLPCERPIRAVTGETIYVDCGYNIMGF